MRFLIRLLINAAALWAAAYVTASLLGGGSISLPDLRTDGGAINSAAVLNLLGVALIFGLLNAFIRPILKLLTCPLQALTLGLFTFVINAFMLWLTGPISQYFRLQFSVNTILAALVGSIIVSIVSIVLSLVVREHRDRR